MDVKQIHGLGIDKIALDKLKQLGKQVLELTVHNGVLKWSRIESIRNMFRLDSYKSIRNILFYCFHIDFIRSVFFDLNQLESNRSVKLFFLYLNTFIIFHILSYFHKFIVDRNQKVLFDSNQLESNRSVKLLFTDTSCSHQLKSRWRAC